MPTASTQITYTSLFNAWVPFPATNLGSVVVRALRIAVLALMAYHLSDVSQRHATTSAPLAPMNLSVASTTTAEDATTLPSMQLEMKFARTLILLRRCVEDLALLQGLYLKLLPLILLSNNDFSLDFNCSYCSVCAQQRSQRVLYTAGMPGGSSTKDF